MYFPVAFQVLFLSLLAALGWAANLRYLSMAGIEVRPILQLPQLSTTTADGHGRPLDDGMHGAIFRLVSVLGGISLTGWLLCTTVMVSPGMQTCITLVTFIVIFFVLIMPQRILCHTVRMQFLGSLVRIVKPSMTDPVFLSDVIMADILTSCARTFADLYLVFCQFSMLFIERPKSFNFAPDVNAELARSVRDRRGVCKDAGIIGAVLVAMPYLFRLRQCVNEYMRTAHESKDRRRHFANAVKYASALPVICLSATQRRVVVDGIMETKYSDWALHVVFGMWILAVAFNSLYSYYWDVSFDWDLGHLQNGWKPTDLITADTLQSPMGCQQDKRRASNDGSAEDYMVGIPGAWVRNERRSEGFPKFLRPFRCFQSPRLYYMAMMLDFLLRITWTIKLTSYIRIDLMAYGGFWLNVLEIYRRWQWTFLRIEKEAAGQISTTSDDV